MKGAVLKVAFNRGFVLLYLTNLHSKSQLLFFEIYKCILLELYSFIPFFAVEVMFVNGYLIKLLRIVALNHWKVIQPSSK